MLVSEALAALIVFLSTPMQIANPPPPFDLPAPVVSLDARKVGYCESGMRNAENPVSSASGYFQFLDGTWAEVTDLAPPASAHSFEVQLEAFEELWDDGRGASHWGPSRYCWQLDEPWAVYDR